MGRLDQKVAVITGSATGIGQATALVFAEQGATVVCADVSLEKAQQTVEQITQQGGKAEAVHVDVSDVESVEQLAKHVKETYGTIDVLFNNAGIDEQGGKVHEYPIDLFDRIIAVDLRGTFLVSKFLIPLMLDNGGSIINTSSMSGRAADLNRSGYNAAKGGIANFTRAMAIDYARHGIRVNSLSPGTIETPLIDTLVGEKEKEQGKQFRDANAWITPLGRLGKPREMATVALFLASDDSSYVTGEDITADGGIMAYTWPGEMLIDSKWKDEAEKSE
ncbi:short-chain dehydrogenase [Exiguobacterium sp. Leaf187]|uniref:SDR family oxidoreductase n=1 Tax=Exiguobacterium indicum TaxID=296995 RepID=A0A0V8GDJ0_9BACL|nr:MULTISPECIES: SDR family oxidoreductase [Exiguobacterium]AHA31119.1 short-chain dehydrogenase [Exiguobacterium sp. MH3]KQS16922.1 short-chain dehydrogenase [Exiguobacterium sp. Leaf187]KSU48323.1 short-chain dehydrogenase [Exiguobacterium enclense]KTR26721.1 short-chain dehydrogenase [Exiguobacterium indicum]MBF8154417.1 SDR family oxidoreductase [Exiguobacterium sp. TBG-PICH-001]